MRWGCALLAAVLLLWCLSPLAAAVGPIVAGGAADALREIGWGCAAGIGLLGLGGALALARRPAPPTTYYELVPGRREFEAIETEWRERP